MIHGSLNVPIEHHPTIRYMVNAMATFSGDVQYTQNGTVTNPCDPMIILIKWYNAGPPRLSRWVYNSHFTMVYCTYNYSIHGAFVNQHSHHWGAPHCSNPGRVFRLEPRDKSRMDGSAALMAPFTRRYPSVTCSTWPCHAARRCLMIWR